ARGWGRWWWTLIPLGSSFVGLFCCFFSCFFLVLDLVLYCSYRIQHLCVVSGLVYQQLCVPMLQYCGLLEDPQLHRNQNRMVVACVHVWIVSSSSSRSLCRCWVCALVVLVVGVQGSVLVRRVRRIQGRWS